MKTDMDEQPEEGEEGNKTNMEREREMEWS